MKNGGLKYFSTFSGIGGFELGIGNRGTCVGYSEIDRYASAVYARHFPEHTNYGDITAIDAECLPDFDLLVGGFPCQAFSVAGKRGGFGDTRGTLFFDLARIAEAKRPRLLLFENVKGLLSHDEGRTFRTIISTLDELGYDLQWQVLNSKDFGVPQNRERVLIVGHLRGTPRPEVFPLGQDGGEHDEVVGQCSEVTGTINSSMSKGGNKQDAHARVLVRVAGTINRGDFKETGGIALNLPASYYKGHDNHGARPMVGEGYSIRRLTPLECERLQGFPDGWTEGISDTQRYKCCGNAVTTNVIQAVAERLLQ